MDSFRVDVKKAMLSNSENDNNKSDTENNKKVIYRVQVGAFSVRQNAVNMLDKIKKAGFDGFITNVELNTEGK